MNEVDCRFFTLMIFGCNKFATSNTTHSMDIGKYDHMMLLHIR